MADKVNKQERSRIMRSVRGRGNASTELKAVRIFREHKITGWRRHLPLIGKPDFAFPNQRLVVFIDGCFWHGCPMHLRMPATNVDYWQGKVARNVARDAKVTAELRSKGWRVLRVWECELKDPSRVARIVTEMLED